jgi:2-O-methyltransferase
VEPAGVGDHARVAGRDPPPAVADHAAEGIFALTSVPPVIRDVPGQQACIRSWRAAGLQVRTFNHASEVEAIRRQLDVDVVPVADGATSAAVFGRNYVTINAMLDWAAERNVPALLINADIELQLTPWELQRVRRIADGGLGYFIRYNYDGDRRWSQREPHGIDAFLLHGRDASLFPRSLLSMGVPFWDYWLPQTFLKQGRPLWSVDFPATFHRAHPGQWNMENWHRCALEFDRLTGVLGTDQSSGACHRMSWSVRQSFDASRTALPREPAAISTWIGGQFSRSGAKTFIEVGAHRGGDTKRLAAVPGATVHAFEPDPRNRLPARPNVVEIRAAIAACDGRAPLFLSQRGWDQEWTHSSSLRHPTGHLDRFPVTFAGTVEVETMTLDSYAARVGLGAVDFIWAAAQGAEGDLIAGGRNTLARTRYLYTQYSDDEMYEGQVSLRQMIEMLPSFRVVELWQDRVLLANRSLG